MNEEIEVTSKARTAAMLAVIAAGDPNDTTTWKRRVQSTLPMYAALVRDDYGYWGKEAQGVIDAQVFTATFDGFTMEESSKRLIVRLLSPKADDGVETIRTERTDIPPGVAMMKRLEQLHKGDEIVAFKKVEPISQSKKVRVLVHIEKVRSKSSSGAEQASRNRPSEPDLPPGPTEGRESDPPAREPEGGVFSDPSPSGSQTAVERRFMDLSTRKRLAFKNRCVGEGITTFMDPGPEDLDRVLVILGEVEKT